MKRRFVVLLTVALAAGSVFAQRSASAKETPADELKRRIDAGEKVLVIDVRSDEEAKSGSIPSAVHVPLAQLEARMKDIPKDVRLVFT
jgi:rhodanese-related sulfurtransferase